MLRNNRAYMKMIHALVNFFVKYAEKIKDNAIIQNTLSLISELVAAIAKYQAIQRTSTKGITKDKNKYKAMLAKTVYLISGIIRTYAFDTKNQTMYDKVKLSQSAIARLGDTRLISEIGIVRKIATTNFTDLEAYGLTQAKLENMEKELETYKGWMSKPREAIANKANATKQMKEKIAELRQLVIGNLDNAMLEFVETDNVFYDEYEEIREIIDPITIRRDLRISVLHEETKQPVANVAVTIVRFKAGAELVNTVKRTTGKTGHTFVSGLEPGKYSAKFEKNGFDTLEVIFYINQNETTFVNVEIRQTE